MSFLKSCPNCGGEWSGVSKDYVHRHYCITIKRRKEALIKEVNTQMLMLESRAEKAEQELKAAHENLAKAEAFVQPMREALAEYANDANWFTSHLFGSDCVPRTCVAWNDHRQPSQIAKKALAACGFEQAAAEGGKA